MRHHSVKYHSSFFADTRSALASTGCWPHILSHRNLASYWYSPDSEPFLSGVSLKSGQSSSNWI